MNLRGWWSLPSAVQVAYIERNRQEVAVRERTAARLEQVPGEALQRDGVDEPPSPAKVDAISEAVSRLCDLHGWQ